MENLCTISLTREEFFWLTATLITLEKQALSEIPEGLFKKLVEAEKTFRG